MNLPGEGDQEVRTGSADATTCGRQETGWVKYMDAAFLYRALALLAA